MHSLSFSLFLFLVAGTGVARLSGVLRAAVVADAFVHRARSAARLHTEYPRRLRTF